MELITKIKGGTNMHVCLSKEKEGKIGVVGHVGVGHVHSHSGFVQDDSAGFATAIALLKKAIPLDTTISAVKVYLQEGAIQVNTVSGGCGKVMARRGFTPAEQELATRAIGQDASFSQNVAVHTFGRIYGQGVMEGPVALQGACALAVIDSFAHKMGNKLNVVVASEENKYDEFAGVVLDIDDIPVALLLVINGTKGGIGPDEDYEGDTNMSIKGKLMAGLGLDKIPTIILESKAFVPFLANNLSENQFMIRAQKDIDCTALGKAIYKAGLELHVPLRLEENIIPFNKGGLAKATQEFADKVIQVAEKMKKVDSSDDKTKLSAELAKLVSENAGGVTFMSNSVYDKMRGVGLLPGITTVVSMIVTKEYIQYWKIPQFTTEEAENCVRFIIEGMKCFYNKN